MKLYNVTNTDGDKPLSSDSWLEALESKLGIELPKERHGEEMAGGHMSSRPGCSGAQNTEYIAYIPKWFNDNQNNVDSIEVEPCHFDKYDEVRLK